MIGGKWTKNRTYRSDTSISALKSVRAGSMKPSPAALKMCHAVKRLRTLQKSKFFKESRFKLPAIPVPQSVSFPSSAQQQNTTRKGRATSPGMRARYPNGAFAGELRGKAARNVIPPPKDSNFLRRAVSNSIPSMPYRAWSSLPHRAYPSPHQRSGKIPRGRGGQLHRACVRLSNANFHAISAKKFIRRNAGTPRQKPQIFLTPPPQFAQNPKLLASP